MNSIIKKYIDLKTIEKKHKDNFITFKDLYDKDQDIVIFFVFFIFSLSSLLFMFGAMSFESGGLYSIIIDFLVCLCATFCFIYYYAYLFSFDKTFEEYNAISLILSFALTFISAYLFIFFSMTEYLFFYIYISQFLTGFLLVSFKYLYVLYKKCKVFKKTDFCTINSELEALENNILKDENLLKEIIKNKRRYKYLEEFTKDKITDDYLIGLIDFKEKHKEKEKKEDLETI
jgi:hypothetical protein